MRTVLMVPLLAASIGLAFASLLIARNRIGEQAQQSLAAELGYSLAAFDDLELQRKEQLTREVALLADLPSLKALMTTRDARTILDAGGDFWRTSGADVFALSLPSGQISALYGATVPDSVDAARLGKILSSTRSADVLLNGRLYELSSAPLYFGSEERGTLLGYVIAGYAIGEPVLRRVSGAAQSEAALVSHGRMLASTLPASAGPTILSAAMQMQERSQAVTARLEGQRYLLRALTIPAVNPQPSGLKPASENTTVQMIVLKSFAPADRLAAQLTHLMAALILGTIAIALLLAGWITRMVTRPLEKLALSAEALGSGQDGIALPVSGVREVRNLSAAFGRMRREISDSQRRLLEAERLATIGRMANSISHDLRHYLAAVYANAEFLSESTGSMEERAQMLGEVRLATYGMTDLLDSLLVFSRTGLALRLTQEPMQRVVENALALIRAHPEANGVSIEFQPPPPGTPFAYPGEARLDVRKVERAIYNLVLNGCQATRDNTGRRIVTVTVSFSEEEIAIRVADNGNGVPEAVRESLFEPFVSEGKESGTGLGLTVAYRVALEHGGSVSLESTRPGQTVFLLVLQRGLVTDLATGPAATQEEENATLAATRSGKE